MKVLGSIVVPGVTLRGEVVKKTDSMQAAFELGRRSAA
jgi:hypothetical protein